MKDKEGTELAAGDLIMLIIDTPVEHPAELVIFLENEEYTYKLVDVDPETGESTERTETTNKIKYYPISDDGLEVAKHDAGQTQTKFHRQQKYIVTEMKSRHLLKMDSNNLSGYEKTLHDSIVALI